MKRSIAKGDKPKYPSPKKGQKVKCLGCNNGLVKDSGQVRKCQTCRGSGYVIA